MTELQWHSPDYEISKPDSPLAQPDLALSDHWPAVNADQWPGRALTDRANSGHGEFSRLKAQSENRDVHSASGGSAQLNVRSIAYSNSDMPAPVALADFVLTDQKGDNFAATDRAPVSLASDMGAGKHQSCGQSNQSRQNILDTSVVSPQELAFMQAKGAVHSPGDVTAIKCDIAKSAQDPEKALLDAAQKNRVVGFGDIHGPLGPQMNFFAGEMPVLKQAGVTHLAVEIPQKYQSYISRWDSSDQDFLRSRLKDRSSLINVIDSAKKVGIDVVGVDELYGANGEMLASRDRTMAKNIESILQDPRAKVTYFVGGEHLQNGFRLDSFGPSAVDLLRKDKISVATFLPQISSSEDSLMHIARSVKSPVSVPVTEAATIGHLSNAAGTTYDKWDNVVFYPPHYRMEGLEAELKQFGKDPATRLEADVASKRVVIVGEMSQAAPEQVDSPHRQFMASLMPDLKKVGLTDLAVDVPSTYQQSFDHYSATGSWDGPLPDSYDHDDFKAVLAAARKAGIKLHAVGLQNESLSTMQQIIDGLTDSTAGIALGDKNARVMLWCREEKIANFDDGQGHNVSVGGNLQSRGITSQSFASLTQDFTDWSLGYATEVTPAPLTFVPGQTKLLQELSNTMGMQINRFDNVIIYPSP